MALVTMSLAACASGFKATYDFDPGHDFSGHTSWAWISKNPMKKALRENGIEIPFPQHDLHIRTTVEGKSD